MFDRLSSQSSQTTSRGKPGGGRAGATPYHRAESYIPQAKRWRQIKWLIYDNNGSFNGWFDWLPLWMRVGYWSPFVVASLVFFYSAIYWYRPQPLQFEATVYEAVMSGKEEGKLLLGIIPKAAAFDLAIFLWGIVVIVHARITLGSIGAFPISFTGWSWLLLSFRAGLEFAAWTATKRDFLLLGKKLAIIGSSIRLVTLTNACVVCKSLKVLIVLSLRSKTHNTFLSRHNLELYSAANHLLLLTPGWREASKLPQVQLWILYDQYTRSELPSRACQQSVWEWSYKIVYVFRFVGVWACVDAIFNALFLCNGEYDTKAVWFRCTHALHV
ncbi:hypothetical protein ACHAWC_009212 [Mediolabrus comicus]